MVYSLGSMAEWTNLKGASHFLCVINKNHYVIIETPFAFFLQSQNINSTVRHSDLRMRLRGVGDVKTFFIWLNSIWYWPSKVQYFYKKIICQ